MWSTWKLTQAVRKGFKITLPILQKIEFATKKIKY